MMKKIMSILLIVFIIGTLAVSSTAAGKGVDRGKFKGSTKSFPVTLTIGNSSFDGKLSRMNNATDAEIEKAIKEALKEMEIDELDIGDAERLVEKVAKDEEFTDEDMKEIRDNLLKLAGLDTLADVIEYVTGGGDKSAGDLAGDYAMDQAKEKALDILMEGLGEGAGGVASTLFDTAVISSDQYEKDQEKWKNRAADAIAKRLLNDFNDKVKEKLEKQSDQRSKGWQLKIDTWASRNFTFYQTEGNLETCKVLIDLKKTDNDEDVGASGTYKGFVDITFDYELSAFDTGFLDWSMIHAALVDSYKSGWPGVKIDTSDEYEPSYVNRKLVNENYSIYLAVPTGKGMTTQTKMDVSSLNDSKMIAIKHKTIAQMNYSADKVVLNHNYAVTYSTDNDEKLSANAVGSGTLTTDGKPASLDSDYDFDVPWDKTIWEQWEKDKWLVITHK